MRHTMLVYILTIFLVLFPLVNSYLSDPLTPVDSGLIGEERKSKKKQDKYLVGLVFGALLCKLVLFPLAVKAMAVMSSVAVLMSAMGLIVSSIVGYAKLATTSEAHEEHVIKIHHVQENNRVKWGKADIALPKGYIPPIPIYHDSNNVSSR